MLYYSIFIIISQPYIKLTTIVLCIDTEKHISIVHIKDSRFTTISQKLCILADPPKCSTFGGNYTRNQF